MSDIGNLFRVIKLLLEGNIINNDSAAVFLLFIRFRVLGTILAMYLYLYLAQLTGPFDIVIRGVGKQVFDIMIRGVGKQVFLVAEYSKTTATKLANSGISKFLDEEASSVVLKDLLIV